MEELHKLGQEKIDACYLFPSTKVQGTKVRSLLLRMPTNYEAHKERDERSSVPSHCIGLILIG